MRDNSEGMIEIVDAFESDGEYFSIIEVPKDSRKSRFRFGVSRESYIALKKILSTRPLVDMPGTKYRYFWDGSMGGKGDKLIFLGIRCEAENEGKSFDFEIPQDLASNIKWFSDLKDLDEAKHLQLET